jgi:hypothetical protein
MPAARPPRRRRRELASQPPGIRELRVDHERVYQALDQQRRYRNLRFNQVARELGVAPGTVTGWGHGIGFSAAHLARVLAWLDRPLPAEFVTTGPPQPPTAADDAA